MTSLLQNVGAFFGIYAFSTSRHASDAARAFAIAFVAAMFATAFTFWNLTTFSDIFWMIPLMGFCQLALFGGYAIYLPELFPTRLRSTGTSFCYNVGRFVAAVGPLALGLLTSRVFAEPRRADAVCGGDDVRGVPHRSGRPAVRAGNQGSSAARVRRAAIGRAARIRPSTTRHPTEIRASRTSRRRRSAIGSSRIHR